MKLCSCLLFIKVYYWIAGPGRQRRRKRDVTIPAHAKMIAVTSSDTRLKLENLKMFTRYNAVVAAFNPAGDGPKSSIMTFTTKQGCKNRVYFTP